MTSPFVWLDWSPLRALLAVLNADGEEARVVGGAVRDALLGEPVHEWDIAATATPDVVSARCVGAGWKVVPTGIEHGTVTVIVDGQPFEVTTLREDVETFGRHATVRFGRDFVRDAERRDFTINALSVGADGHLFDPTGGVADIKARRVRFIGNPSTRIAEDALRILRFFRFHARFGTGEPDADGLRACIEGRGGIDRLSRERVRAEMIKLVVAPAALTSLRAMDEAGLLLRILGGIARIEVFAEFARLEAQVALPAEPMRRLAALATFVREDAENLGERLRLSRAEARVLTLLAAQTEAISALPSSPAIRALGYRLGPVAAGDVLLLAAARSGGGANWVEAIATARATLPPRLPWRSADLTAAGVPTGPRIGVLLADLEKRWIEADFPADTSGRDAIFAAALADQPPETGPATPSKAPG